MSQIRLNPDAAAGNTVPCVFDLLHIGSAGNMQIRSGMPPVISRGQAYFWTRTWQDFENESAQALAAGEFSEFDNPREAIRWLLSSED